MALDTLLVPETPPDPDSPRRLDRRTAGGDRTFFVSIRGIGLLVVLLVGAIGVFLGYQLVPTLRDYGLSFFTSTEFNPERNVVGILSAIVGTIEIAVIALLLAFPLGLCTALYISEYAPGWAKSLLVSVLDLMAAIPSIVFGVWGFFFLGKHLIFVSRWLDQWFGWFPLLSVHNGKPTAADFPQYRYASSAFVAGAVVALMVVPLAASVMRNVFAQTPVGEREAALALGSTRWGVVRTVVLPFGRGGIIGGTMLGLGRALGETIAVLFVVSFTFNIKIRILETGAVTISSLIANSFGDASGGQLSALLAAGFVLFAMTLVVNTLAAIVVGRSRSGASTEL